MLRESRSSRALGPGIFGTALLATVIALSLPTSAVAQITAPAPAVTPILGSAVAASADTPADSLVYTPMKRNFWRAAGTTVGINALVWSYNRFLRESGENPGFRISLDSWENSQKNGFEWDDNSFSTNQFAHPYHGSLYFNAARSNGYTFWESVPFAFAGSYMWEYFGETHHAAYNDWIATSIGGTALGESLHRLSAMIVDNRKTGWGRFWSEAGGFLVNPMGGLTRIFSGQMGKVGANPPDRFPSKLRTTLEIGARSIGENRLWEADTTRVYMKAHFLYGDPFAGDIEKPFDTFDFLIQLNFGDASGIGQAEAKGLLFATELSETENSTHLLAALQHYEYINNNAYEFGGQSISASYLSQIQAGPSTLQTGLHLTGLLLGGTKSDYESFTGRSYDYGPGFGFKLRATLLRRGRPFFTVGHSNHWIYVLNGNSATHLVAFTFARLDLPLHHFFGVGFEYDHYHAERNYKDFADVSQTNPELRAFINWIFD